MNTFQDNATVLVLVIATCASLASVLAMMLSVGRAESALSGYTQLRRLYAVLALGGIAVGGSLAGPRGAFTMVGFCAVGALLLWFALQFGPRRT